jgi:hypothetical protein
LSLITDYPLITLAVIMIKAIMIAQVHGGAGTVSLKKLCHTLASRMNFVA